MEKKNYEIVKKSVSINDSYNNKKNNLSNRDKIKRRNTENNNISYISSDIKLKSFGNNKKKFISPFKLNYDNKINKTENKETFYNPIDIKKRLQQKNIKIFKLNNNENNKNKIKIFKISNNIKFSILKEKKNKNMNLQIVKSVSNYECINFNYNNKKDIIIKHINDIDLNNIHKKSDLILLEKKLQILTNKIRTKLNLPVDKEGEEKLLDTFGALLIDRNVEFESIRQIAYGCEKKFLKDVNLFDVYEGKNLEVGKKSYAVNFILQDENKTMNDKQVDAIMNKIIQSLEKQLGAKLR